MMQIDTVDFAAIKERQRMGWEAGDYPGWATRCSSWPSTW